MSPWERMGCALTDIGTFWTNHSERGQSRFLSQSVMAKSGNRTAHSPSPSHIMTHYAKTTNSLGIQIELIELTESFFSFEMFEILIRGILLNFTHLTFPELFTPQKFWDKKKPSKSLKSVLLVTFFSKFKNF